METLPLFVIILYFIGASNAAVLEGVCTTNTDCTVTNSYCKKDFDECTSGKCKCSAGYTSDGSACKISKTYDMACSTNTDMCQPTTTCTGSPLKCRCASSDTYNANLKMCIAPSLKEIGGTCTDVSNCYASVTGSVECIAATGSSQKYCRCKTGYSTKEFKCTLPFLNEHCSLTYGCRISDYISGDNSINDPSCTSSTCSCPSSNTAITGTHEGNYYQQCQAPLTGNPIAAGQACTASNQCTTKSCQTCPESSSTKKCVSLRYFTVGSNGVLRMAGGVLTPLLGFATVLFFYRD